MKFRIKQNSLLDAVDPTYRELVGSLSYPQIRTILDDLPREHIKEITVIIDSPEVFNAKED
jgi:hypothetical protein